MKLSWLGATLGIAYGSSSYLGKSAETFSRYEFLEWVEAERTVCPVVKRLGLGMGQTPILRKCAHRPCPSGQLASSLQDSPLDGTCRTVGAPPPGAMVGYVYGTLFPHRLKEGEVTGKMKRRYTELSRDNEHDVALRWKTEINRNLPAYLEGLSHHSTLAFAFAHFVDHEMVMTAETIGASDCVRCSDTSPTCSRIPILQPDLIDHLGEDCFIRSNIEQCTESTPNGGPELLATYNQVTGWIDASGVYGVSEADLLRLGFEDNPYLREDFDDQGNPFLPFSSQNPMCFHSGFCRCVDAGDGRASAHAGLTTIHTAFVRLHNFVADLMEDVPLTLKESRLRDAHGPTAPLAHKQPFARVREFVIYALQKIVYEELLPVLIGPRMIKLLGNPALQPRSDIGIVKEFHAGLFRLHQLVPEMDWVVDADQQILETTPMQVVFNPLYVLTHGTRGIARGLLARPHSARYSFFTHTTDQMLSSFDRSGFDIVAVNIMRGREEGLLPYGPLYRDARNVLKLAGIDGPKRPIGFVPPLVENIEVDFGPTTYGTRYRQSREEPFKGADHTDAFVGAVSELPVEHGALLGGTQSAVILQVFNSLAVSDPFFYTKRRNYLFEHGLKKMNAQTLLCLLLLTSGDPKERVANNPFLLESGENHSRSCLEVIRDFQFAISEASFEPSS